VAPGAALLGLGHAPARNGLATRTCSRDRLRLWLKIDPLTQQKGVMKRMKYAEQLKDRAAKATGIAIGLWVALLAALVGMILLLRKG
jgi:hypothetical protein